MAPHPRPQLHLLLLLTLPALFPLTRSSAPADKSLTLRILPAFNPSESFLSVSARDVSRLSYLSSLRRSFAPIASARGLLQSSTYVARASLGTPSQALLVALDISSDIAWFPCASCSGCPSPSFFSPNRSSTFLPIPCASPHCTQLPSSSCAPHAPCSFNFTYGGTSVSAALSLDTLSLASDSVPSYAFACVVSITPGSSIPAQGLLGLGRGPLSFLSQTKPLYSSTFSYCLPGFRSQNFSGTLRLGLSGQPRRIRTTPLLSNPRRPSLYYVNMTGIRVGSRPVQIPPEALAFNPATGAGTVFDSGTMFTRLVAPAYAALRDEFRRRVGAAVTALGGFDTCYGGQVAVPAIAFEFDGGMRMTLPEENIMIRSSSGSLSCLAMAASPENVNSVVNVIASAQQQNHRVLFDLPNARVGVSREPCTV